MLTMGRRRIRSQRRTMAPARRPPSHQEERTGGCKEGAESKASPRTSEPSPRQRTHGRRGRRQHSPCPLISSWFPVEPTVVEGSATRGPHLAI